MEEYMKKSYISAAEVAEFVYCPLCWYYRYVKKINLYNDHVEIGKYVHEKYRNYFPKRKNLFMTSEKYRIKGVIDFIEYENGIPIPVEVKKGKIIKGKGPFKDHILQLMVYILLLEDNLRIKIPYGYIIYSGSRKKFRVEKTKSRTRDLRITLRTVRGYLYSGKKPPNPGYGPKCNGCTFAEFCKI